MSCQQHSCHPWVWSGHDYFRSCQMDGCSFKERANELCISGNVLLENDSHHEHSWGPWSAVGDEYIPPKLFSRRCSCGTTQWTDGLEIARVKNNEKRSIQIGPQKGLMFTWLKARFRKPDLLRPGDRVRVLISPGAPFDIGEIFTVRTLHETSLPISVEERSYRFHPTWFKKVLQEQAPSPAIIRTNGHEFLRTKCINCHSEDSSTLCPGPSV